MYYRSKDPDYGHGSMDLLRLTNIESLDCSNPAAEPVAPPAGDFTLTQAISGAWYPPGHVGEGWVFEILGDGRALIAWFSYDADGNQAWFLNEGVVSGNTITFSDLLIPSGTDFGPSFNPGDVELPSWGNATFTFDSCDSGTMTYSSSLPGYGSGSLALTRLTNLKGMQCQ